MPIDPDVAIGAELPDRTFSWESSDVLLYHLGIGAGSRPGDNLDPAALRYTLDNDDLQVLPSFGIVAPTFHETDPPPLDLPGLRHQPRRRSCTAARRSRSPLRCRRSGRRRCAPASPTSGTRARPPSSGRRARRSRPRATPLWTVRSSIFVRGEGGWGGDRGTSTKVELPDRRARLRCVVRRDAAAGAALPPLRRPQPAARRPGVRQGRRLPGADPARPVLLRHRAAHGHRRAARRRRRQGPRASPPASPAWSSRARRSGCAPGTPTRASSSRRPSAVRASATARRCSPTACSRRPDGPRSASHGQAGIDPADLVVGDADRGVRLHEPPLAHPPGGRPRSTVGRRGHRPAR